MNSLAYANEKFYVAVDALAGHGSLQQRLRSAYLSFHPIKAEDFYDPKLRQKYKEIMRRLIVVRDASPNEGRSPATFERMNDGEAQKLSSLIVELAFDIAEACATH